MTRQQTSWTREHQAGAAWEWGCEKLGEGRWTRWLRRPLWGRRQRRAGGWVGRRPAHMVPIKGLGIEGWVGGTRRPSTAFQPCQARKEWSPSPRLWGWNLALNHSSSYQEWSILSQVRLGLIWTPATALGRVSQKRSVRGSGKLRHLPEVTQPGSSGTGIGAQVSLQLPPQPQGRCKDSSI